MVGADVAEDAVFLLAEPGGQTGDQVRTQRRDCLVVELQIAQRLGVRPAEPAECPRVDPERVVFAGIGTDPDRDNAEREEIVVVSEPERDDPFGAALDPGPSVLVRDGGDRSPRRSVGVGSPTSEPSSAQPASQGARAKAPASVSRRRRVRSLSMSG